ncbi:MAG: hypothetical protein Fur0037_07100 [Planctomycetota bacterium]
MPSSTPRRIPAFLAACCAADLFAQCADPPAPQGGFPVSVATDRLVTFSDAYRTRADARYPAVPAGSCGWPLLIGVHGFPDSKNGPLAAEAADLAAAGYFVATYDVRGQGSGIALNPQRGTTLMGFDEWIDMFEVMEWAEASFPALVDSNRIGVFGLSQGGAHAWAAAAWSGRVPPPNSRRSAPFPVVRAAAPAVMVPSHADATTMGGTAFLSAWAGLAFAPPNSNYVLDSAFQSTMRAFLLADDPAGMHAWMRADPGRDFQSLLPYTTTAILVRMAWLDRTMSPNSAVRGAATTSGPSRALLTTGYHGTPANDYETARAAALRRAWFDRFLKNSPFPAESGPFLTSAALPEDHATYTGALASWRQRADAAFPPPSSTPVSFYLRQGGILAATAPLASEPPDAIVHGVPAGYDVLAWRRDGAGQNVALALSRMPRSAATWTSAPFSTDTEVAGIPVLHLEITAHQPRFLLGVRLEAVPANGSSQVISEGVAAVRLQGNPGPGSLSIEMRASDCVLSAGSRLRLTVQNHDLVVPSTAEEFRFMPVFSSFQVDLEHRPGAASFLQLPLRGEPGLDLSTAALDVGLLAPQPVTFRLNSSAAEAGAPYWILGSMTGEGPAVALPGGGQLFLSIDWFTPILSGAGGSPLFTGFAGLLDGNGSSSASMDLSPVAPLPAALLGLSVHLAPIAIGRSFVAGAPVSLAFR